MQFAVVTVATRIACVRLYAGTVAETDATLSIIARNARACIVEVGDVGDSSEGGDAPRATRRLYSVTGEVVMP